MAKKIYSSFEQIDTDLEILSIEKEINYQKIILGFHKTKEQFTPSGLTKNVFSTFKSIYSGIYSGISNTNNTVLTIVIPLLIKWILNKKRSR
ncbi:DUF6327 family protein [Flavobacterium sp. NG2]|uniref:DUF6327 family protein n=1 Tax=Flavobacterium sp. NG2 TaxID=3097547 RepID=UPI002A80397D|nr:DUF6327 family protein [Flavobacterium sp. NG2]WPR72245.1 DUF6327 family protein [Flavobacterium sp. NG2]